MDISPQETTFNQQVSKNRVKSILLFIGFFLFAEAVIAAIMYFGTGTLNLISFLVGSGAALIVMTVMYFITPKVAVMMARAEEITADSEPVLWNVVEELALAGGTPMPRVYVMRNEQYLNAFATGRDMKHGHVLITQGLLDTLTREELEGVIAHELSHLRNGDIKVMTLAASLAMIIGVIADMATRVAFFGGGNRNNNGPGAIISVVALLLVAILAPLTAVIIQSAISRNREALADASAIELTRNPVGLENALTKISQGGSRVSTAKEQSAHMFFSDPFSGKGKKVSKREKMGKWVERLFSTHPPIQERIDLLRAYRGG